MYFISRPPCRTENSIWSAPARNATSARRRIPAAASPLKAISAASAPITAAAGALGAEMRMGLPRVSGVKSPSAAAPARPAAAPRAAASGPRGERMATPNATAEGRATKAAAKPPHRSWASGRATASFEAIMEAWAVRDSNPRP